ncbi:MAG: hypothetical protein IJD60_10485 [Clostridia bacterium]|nr:hypothetical protein [Clostridia bacterium]
MQNLPASKALLSSSGNFTIFKFGKHVIRFRTSPRLERYTSVREWDRGYLVVTARYKNLPHEEEEYIDLVPILNNLYFNAEESLSPIKEVAIQYE